jgi:shikimate kinase
MLVAQGLKAEELWLGKKISDREIEEVIAYVEKEKRNIVLIGMPSCGKSTIAKLLSKKTGKPVYDTDALVESLEKTSIPELFSTQGEGYFRDAETKAIKEVSILSGVIIATGGGAILREENRKALSQNGFIVYLDRPLEKLLSDGRPLSQKNGIKKLFEERKDIYEKFADAKVAHTVKTIELDRRIITDEEYASAKAEQEIIEAEVLEFDTEGTPKENLISNSKKLCERRRRNGILNNYEAQKTTKTRQMELHVIRIGDIAFATNTFELYMDYQHRIQARSPFEQTFVVQLCAQPTGCVCGSYLATERGAKNKGYSASVFCNQVSPSGGAQLVEETLAELYKLAV